MTWFRSNKKGSGGVTYADISSFAFYFKRNTTQPTVTKISDYEFAFTFTDQNASGYELCSFSTPLSPGLYVAEIYATVNKNTGISSNYLWGVYSSYRSADAQLNAAYPKIVSGIDITGFSTYVPFDRSDTNEHYYEVPIKIPSNGTTCFICVGTSDDNGVNATITVSSLKIRLCQ